jgi:DNA-binding MarR family transcriptional regulator
MRRLQPAESRGHEGSFVQQIAGARPNDELLERIFEGWRDLRRGAVKKLNAAFYGGREDSLDPGQLDVLEVISSRASWRMRPLALTMHLDASSVTRSIDRLEADGLVTRVATASDGRGVQVRATKKGRDACREIAPRRLAAMRETLSNMPLWEVEELARLLEKLVSGVNAYAARLETADDDWSPPTN